MRGIWGGIALAVAGCASFDEAVVVGDGESTAAVGDADSTAAADGPAADGDDSGDAGADGPAATTGADPGSTGQPTGGGVAGSGSSGGGEASTGDPAMPGPNDGHYVGPFAITFTTDVGVGGPCEGELVLDVLEGTLPEITGSGACTAAISGVGNFPVDLQVDGAVASPLVAGELVITGNGSSHPGPWNGELSGDTMTATFSGSYTDNGINVTYTGEWTVTR